MQLKVFISSRLKELEEERTAVEEAISELWNNENLPFTIWRWESAREIPSGKPSPKVQSEGVRDSDVYVLIIGSEYGDFEYGRSPTHKEYDIACSELEEDSILIYIKEVEGREEKLENWLKELKSKHTTKSFKNSDQLKDLIKTRLRDLWNKGRWKVNIPTIQSTLRKEETTEGDFFKKEPGWIDFEESFVVERKEVEEIIENLENDNIQLVLGEPASGKSVILKNIGFKLATKNKDVYVVELKKHSSDEVKRYFDDIPEIKDEKTVFIVDDAHLLPTECERLVREFKIKNRQLKAKLVIGSRETREIRGEHPKEASEFEYLSKTKIHAEDVTEEMIKTFLKRKYGFSNERINTVSKNLKEYKKDLWHLSWALKAYKPEKDSLEEEEIYEKVKDSIRDISAGKGKPKIDAEDIFLPLSVFYWFEIPAERNFLEEQLEIEEDKINQLIELSEIVQTEEAGRNRMLSLIHSSIAELYFGAYRAYPSLGRRIKKKILNQRDEDLQYCLFYHYMTGTDPRNAVDVIYHLGRWADEKGGRKLIKKMINDKEIEKSIKEGIEKEEEIWKINWCVSNVTKANEEAGSRLANLIDIDALSLKVEKDEYIREIGCCVRDIAEASEEAGLRLGNRVIGILASKIEKEEDMEKIGDCLGYIDKASKELGLKMTNRIIGVLQSKIEKEEDIWKIVSCVWHIAKVSKEAGRKLANRIDVDLLSSKIEKEKDIEKTGWCVIEIAEASEEVALKLVDAVSSKIEKEDDIGKIGECVSCIAEKGNEEIRLKLANRIDINNLLLKIEKEEDVEKIGSCVLSIPEAGENVGLKLVNRINIVVLSSKIGKESDIKKIESCVRDISITSEKVGSKLASCIDIDVLSLRIENAEDIRNIGDCMWHIAQANKKVGLKLANHIDAEALSSKIEKEEDIEKIGRCVWHIAEASKKAALKLVEVVSSKIEKEDDIWKIKKCVRDIARANEEVAQEIVNRLNPKIRKELQKGGWLR